MIRRFLIGALAALCLTANAGTPLLIQVAATGAGTSVRGIGAQAASNTYQVTGTTTSGSGSAIVNIEGSNDGVNWDVIGTITLTLSTTSSSGSFSSMDRYSRIRGNVTTLSGTGAQVSATAGL